MEADENFSSDNSHIAEDLTNSMEPRKKSKKYPKHIFLIIGNEFCERFSYYGMRTILILYLRNFLLFGDDAATAMFHAFVVISFFTPLMGGIIADSYWGKYKTILYLSLLYVVGHGFKTVAAIPYIPSRATHITLSAIGILLIAIGTGGIKPCVSSLGGDQFTPDQDVYRKQYFSLFYFSINCGALLAKLVVPIFRTDLNCYPGEEGEIFQECYSVAFGVPGILMLIAIVLFVIGTPLYTLNKPTGSVFSKFCKCVYSACKNRWKTNAEQRGKKHWIEYSDSSPQMIQNSKNVLNILLLFSPLPMFWALFDQQGSRWTLQALQLDRYWGNLLVKPEQMDIFNPLLVLTLIPVFEFIIFPLLRRLKISFPPIRQMTVGLILTGLSFVSAAILQFEIDKTITPLPTSSEFAIRVVNTASCDLTLSSNLPSFKNLTVDKHKVSNTQLTFMSINEWKLVEISHSGCESTSGNFSKQNHRILIIPHPEKFVEIVFGGRNGEFAFQSFLVTKKPENGGGKVSFVNSDPQRHITVNFFGSVPSRYVAPQTRSTEIVLPIGMNFYQVLSIPSTTNTTGNVLYEGEIFIKTGGVYSVFLVPIYAGRKNYSLIAIGDENSGWVQDLNHNAVNVAWMIPQYFIITVGEVLVSITGLEFSYTQAPKSMKSVVSSFWLLTVSAGSMIVMIVSQIKSVERQAHEFLLFAFLIGVATMAFIFLGRRYIPVDEQELEKEKVGTAETRRLLNKPDRNVTSL